MNPGISEFESRRSPHVVFPSCASARVGERGLSVKQVRQLSRFESCVAHSCSRQRIWRPASEARMPGSTPGGDTMSRNSLVWEAGCNPAVPSSILGRDSDGPSSRGQDSSLLSCRRAFDSRRADSRVSRCTCGIIGVTGPGAIRACGIQHRPDREAGCGRQRGPGRLLRPMGRADAARQSSLQQGISRRHAGAGRDRVAGHVVPRGGSRTVLRPAVRGPVPCIIPET